MKREIQIKRHPKDTCWLLENVMAVKTALLHPVGLTHTCLLMPLVKQKDTGLRISKGGARGQYPVMKIERRIKKKVLNTSLRLPDSLRQE